jgi:micrococcal nuclease
MGLPQLDWRCAVVFVALVMPARLLAAEVTPQQAGAHVGETATVCGVVASANYSVRTKGQPTFLNLDQPYPKQVFTVLIWGSDRSKFGTPEVQWMGKRLCATGKIEAYRGKPEIVATDPRQLSSR